MNDLIIIKRQLTEVNDRHNDEVVERLLLEAIANINSAYFLILKNINK